MPGRLPIVSKCDDDDDDDDDNDEDDSDYEHSGRSNDVCWYCER